MEKEITLEEIKKDIKETLIQVLQLENSNIEDIKDDTPFFGSEENPGLIQDSLAVLEISTRLAEKYDISPSEFTEESYTNVEALSILILSQIKNKNDD